MERIQATQNVLVITNNKRDSLEVITKLEAIKANITSKSLDSIPEIGESKFDAAVLLNLNEIDAALPIIFSILKPNGIFIVPISMESSNLELNLKINGFINVGSNNNHYSCNKPSYNIGSSTKVSIQKPSAVWKLDDTDETIDPDNLLDEEDLKKPTAESLRVCGTTGQRKACKDCSCGLAEELAGEVQGDMVDTSNAPKSSCGSCYLGDAFRCAACPYLGMPAFKPGEKIQLAGNQLKDDL